MIIRDEDEYKDCQKAYREVDIRFLDWDQGQDPYLQYEKYLTSEESQWDLEDYGCLLTLEMFIKASAYLEFNNSQDRDYSDYYEDLAMCRA